IRNTAGEGNDQLVDDMYSTPDGKSVVASRPSYADVVSINIATGKINWRTPVEGFRADHMAVSPDGQQVAVSASSGNVVHIIDINTGKELGRVATGDKPHENIYFANGTTILNSAIGNVETAMDASWQDFTKGKRYITIADANNFKVLKKIDFRPALDAFGRKDLSNAVRQIVFS
ncbi:YncE family protein, partial [Acinetobacter baumannii]|nr:YncE family protein [Acinetobacter baumannii]